MNYTEKNLMTGEKIIFKTRLNWTIFLPGLLVLIAGLSLIRVYFAFAEILIVAAGLMLISSLVRILTSEFVVTNERIIIKIGFLRTESLETLLKKIEAVKVDQGIIGKLANKSMITVTGTGGTHTPFRDINKPYEFRRAVIEQIEKIQ